MAYIGDKEEDTDRIEKKINEIMKKDINMGTQYRTDQLGAQAGNNEADSYPGGEKNDIVSILWNRLIPGMNAKQVYAHV